MTTQMVRMMAKEIAGAFYEGNQRTLRFRRQWPSQDDFVAKSWMHFVDLGRGALAAMLAQENVPPHRKQAIMDELIEDHERQANNPRAMDVIQATLDPREREDVRMIDSTPLPGVSG